MNETPDVMTSNHALQPPSMAAFYEAHNRWLFSWLRKKLGCHFDAADLAQDTFLRILSKQNLQDIVEPRAYLTTVAHGLMVNHLRRRDIEKAYLAELDCLPASETPSTETRLMVLETLIRIDAMLDGLPPRVRLAFLLHQLEDLTYAEIAARLRVSISSVRQYVARALLHCLVFQEENR